MKDYEQVYQDFWKGILEDENGNTDIDKVKRELYDYSVILDQVPLVYDYVTGGVCSKPNTCASVVKSLVDDYYDSICKEVYCRG